jgi:ketosteroid isomerase-like protein
MEDAMENIELVKEITGLFARNTEVRAVLDRYFAPDFVHWANGRQSDLKSYAARLDGYRNTYDGFSIPAWDELFAADDRVVVAYTLEAKKKDGSVERIPVMAIWRLKDGKVVALREVDGH